MSSGVARCGKRRGEQEVETACGGGGHGGVVLVLFLGSGAFVFDKNSEWYSFLCRSQNMIPTILFCRNWHTLQVC